MQKRSIKVHALSGSLHIYDVTWLEMCDLESGNHDDKIQETLQFWYSDIKEKLSEWTYNVFRSRTCMICGKNMTTFDAHHAIVQKNDWTRKKRLLIDCELNLVPLHNQCHLESPPSRQECWDYNVEFYGEDLMRDWYEQLPWKQGHPPRRFW